MDQGDKERLKQPPDPPDTSPITGLFPKSTKTQRTPSKSNDLTRGKANEPNVFERLMRTKGSKLSRSNQELSTAGLEDNELDQENKGDKRMRSPNQVNGEAKRAKSELPAPAFDRMVTKLNELMKIVEAQPTTARNIKNGLIQLNELVEEATTEYLALKTNCRCPQPTEALLIRDQIKENMELNEIEDVISQEWPNEVYKNTTLNPRDTDPKTNIKGIIVSLDNLEEDKNFNNLKQIIPEAGEITKDLLRKHGAIEITQNETTKISGMRAESTHEKRYLIQPALNLDNGSLSTADVINCAESIKKALKKNNSKSAEVFLPFDTASITRGRKIIECCLVATDIKILVRTTKEQRKLHQSTATNDTLIVRRSDGSTYSDIVKELKDTIQPEQFGVTVKGLRSTMNGDVKIILHEDKPGGKSALLTKIRNSVTTAKSATCSTRTKGIVILDIEDDITPKDIIGALTQSLNIEESDVTLNPLRNMRRGTKMITAFLPANKATEAISMKRIKIGWTLCPIKERIEPPLCPKCKIYITSGHKCQDERVVHRCFKCGGNHHTKDCNSGTEHCFNCNTDGHRANQMKCPIYGDLIRNARKH